MGHSVLTRMAGMHVYKDKATGEIFSAPGASFRMEEDFEGIGFAEAETGYPGYWEVVEVNLNSAIALVADLSGGVLGLVMDADANAEDGVLYWGDQRGVDVSKGCIFHARVALQVLPSAAEARMVWGLCGDHNLAKDDAAVHAWFRCEGGNPDALLVETDDTTNDNDDVDAGATLLAATVFHFYTIDFTNLADVKFYVDGAQVAAGTTFDMSNLTAAEAIMQPYFSVEKDSGTGVGSMYVDFVKCYTRRS